MVVRSNSVLIASLFVVAIGCTPSASTISPEILSSYQSALSLADEPDQAASILEVRELLGGGETPAQDHDDQGHHAEDGHDADGTEHAQHNGQEHAAHDRDEKDHHAEDGDGHDVDGTEHAQHNGQEHAERAHDHEGHDEGDAHGKHEDPDGHEHGEDGQEHTGHEHDGLTHEHADHEHGDQEHSRADGHEIVIVGKIGGAAGTDRTLSDFPWEKGLATFIISDPSFESTHADDHGHEDHDCPYCQAKAVDAQAWVRFLGDDDKPIAVDARELFDVKEGDIVVVKGHAKLSAGLLVVDAKGIYVRR